MARWLVKTEPGVFSIDDFARVQVTDWTGVRNYQARNFLCAMRAKDSVLVYHSNAQPSAVVGLASVLREARPDPTQFDRKSEYFDPKSIAEKPRWFCPDLSFVQKFRVPIALDALKEVRALSGLLLLERGSRLSVIPVSEKHFDTIMNLAV